MFCAIDTDILLYKATTTVEKAVDWGDDIWSLWCDLKDAKALFQKQCDEIAEQRVSETSIVSATTATTFARS